LVSRLSSPRIHSQILLRSRSPRVQVLDIRTPVRVEFESQRPLWLHAGKETRVLTAPPKPPHSRLSMPFLELLRSQIHHIAPRSRRGGVGTVSAQLLSVTHTPVCAGSRTPVSVPCPFRMRRTYLIIKVHWQPDQARSQYDDFHPDNPLSPALSHTFFC